MARQWQDLDLTMDTEVWPLCEDFETTIYRKTVLNVTIVADMLDLI